MQDEPHQETEGWLSPLVRNIRLRQVARRIAPHSLVLDLACGNGWLGPYLPTGCAYYGVDRLTPTAPSRFDGFLPLDLGRDRSFEDIAAWLPRPADVITVAAFLEHIPDPAGFLAKARRLLRPGGSIVGTTPHPRGRSLHDSLARLYLCSRSGAAEHETFLNQSDIARAAVASGGTLSDFDMFLAGLNQVFVLRYGADA